MIPHYNGKYRTVHRLTAARPYTWTTTLRVKRFRLLPILKSKKPSFGSIESQCRFVMAYYYVKILRLLLGLRTVGQSVCDLPINFRFSRLQLYKKASVSRC